jgi:amino acid transporter
MEPPSQAERPTVGERIKRLLIGKPRDLADQSIFRHVSLIAILAWVGLGADGLSSSCYGPSEAFTNLVIRDQVTGEVIHDCRYLAVFLVAAIVATVFTIATCYSHIIEAFPSGGGGYLVASKLLGQRIGVVSGCALLVDYVMTITVSIASAGDALFSLLDPAWGPWKIWAEAAVIIVLIVLNLRGVKESVQVLLPIFVVFLVAHVVLIVGSIGMHLPAAGQVAGDVSTQIKTGIGDPQLGLLGMLVLLLHAYSLGAGTYTGLEAVSNSMPVIREPRVHNAKKTMRYMALSLSFVAGGLIVAYLLLDIRPAAPPSDLVAAGRASAQSHPDGPPSEAPAEGAEKTMNYLLTEKFVGDSGLGRHWLGVAFVIITLVSEGALLVVGAQAGFIDGPRVLGYMAHDSWAPRWFSSLSERLATENGILLMGLSALAALWYTGGSVKALVIMYSINVFVTFSLSMIGMCRHWFELRKEDPLWRRRFGLFLLGATLCLSILGVTVVLKFREGGWRTLAVTGLCVTVSFLIHRYYEKVGAKLKVPRPAAEFWSAEPGRARPGPAGCDGPCRRL